jgi:carboxyl-terminal processing protease
MKRLVLDLRGNPGGVMQAAIQMIDQFLPKGKLIVYTKGTHQAKESFYATQDGIFEKQPVVVLIDESSASASEIFAGAIQDNDRGLIIGRRSFGKGLVQQQMSFPDGAAVRLTVARYYTPTGRCIQKSYKDGTEAYYNEFYKRVLDGELTNKDSIKYIDSLKFKTPGGKTVYGGGGITPDIFIPVETGEKYRYYNMLINKGVIFEYAFELTDKLRKSLLANKNFDNFKKSFTITPEMFTELTKRGEKAGIKYDAKNAKLMEVKINLLLKAYIARNIYGDDGFFTMLLEDDIAYHRALKEIVKMK